VEKIRKKFGKCSEKFGQVWKRVTNKAMHAVNRNQTDSSVKFDFNITEPNRTDLIILKIKINQTKPNRGQIKLNRAKPSQIIKGY